MKGIMKAQPRLKSKILSTAAGNDLKNLVAQRLYFRLRTTIMRRVNQMSPN